MLTLTPKQITSFWNNIIKSDSPNCWISNLHKNKKGYTNVHLRIDGARHFILSHRLSWILTKGEIPDGLCVCHTCDNPSCVNPDHLFLGTVQDNILDKMLKGRHYSGLTDPDKKFFILESAKTSEALGKRKEKFKEIQHQQKELNSQYGTFWITNGFENKKWEVSLGTLPDGFSKGRKIN